MRQYVPIIFLHLVLFRSLVILSFLLDCRSEDHHHPLFSIFFIFLYFSSCAYTNLRSRHRYTPIFCSFLIILFFFFLLFFSMFFFSINWFFFLFIFRFYLPSPQCINLETGKNIFLFHFRFLFVLSSDLISSPLFVPLVLRPLLSTFLFLFQQHACSRKKQASSQPE